MIQTKGFSKLNAKLEKLANLKANTKPLMINLGEAVKNEIEFSFEREASPFGNKWQALKSATLKQKLAKNKTHRILRRDGNLSDRWHLSASNTNAIISNNSKSNNGFSYGLVHQFGSTKRNIPARAFLPVDSNGNAPNALMAELEDEMVEFIKEQLR